MTKPLTTIPDTLRRLDLDELSNIANEAGAKAESHAVSAVDQAVIAGDALAAARSKLRHGQWLPWLAEHWRYSQRLAYQYIAVANLQRAANLEGLSSIREALQLIAEPEEPEETAAVGSDAGLGVAGPSKSSPLSESTEPAASKTKRPAADPEPLPDRITTEQIPYVVDTPREQDEQVARREPSQAERISVAIKPFGRLAVARVLFDLATETERLQIESSWSDWIADSEDE